MGVPFIRPITSSASRASALNAREQREIGVPWSAEMVAIHLAQRDSVVFSAAAGRDLAVAIAMASDSGRDIDVTVDIHLQTTQLTAVAYAAGRSATVPACTFRRNSFETV
jgi:hypothetical protein